MPIFDTSARGTHSEDFLLLQNGHLHMARHPWALARLRHDLASLGYDIATLDLSTCGDADDVRRATIEAIPNWPDGYGARNWDAFADGLSDYLLDTAHPQRNRLAHDGRPASGDRADRSRACRLEPSRMVAGTSRRHPHAAVDHDR
jgi:hypothetical protein